MQRMQISEEELIFRDVEVDEESKFLSPPVNENDKLMGQKNHSTSNILTRCLCALRKLKLGLTKADDEEFFLEDLDGLINKETKVNMFNIMKEVNKISKQREQKELCSFAMKGH